MLAQIFKRHDLEATDHLYKPLTDSKAARQLVKVRNGIYLDNDIPVLRQLEIVMQIDEILKHMDSVDMELPRYGL